MIKKRSEKNIDQFERTSGGICDTITYLHSGCMTGIFTKTTVQVQEAGI